MQLLYSAGTGGPTQGLTGRRLVSLEIPGDVDDEDALVSFDEQEEL